MNLRRHQNRSFRIEMLECRIALSGIQGASALVGSVSSESHGGRGGDDTPQVPTTVSGSDDANHTTPGSDDTSLHTPGSDDTTSQAPGLDDTTPHIPGSDDTTPHTPGSDDNSPSSPGRHGGNDIANHEIGKGRQTPVSRVVKHEVHSKPVIRIAHPTRHPAPHR